MGPGMVPDKWTRLSETGVILMPEASMSLLHSCSSFCTRPKSTIFFKCQFDSNPKEIELFALVKAFGLNWYSLALFACLFKQEIERKRIGSERWG